MDRIAPALFAGLVALAVGVATAGAWLADAYVDARAAERHVTVKGLAEREVPADLVIWPITFTVTANDLGTLDARLADGETRVRSFFAERFPDDEIRAGEPQVEDRARWGWDGRGERYTAQATVTLRTTAVAGVHDARAAAGALVKQGVATTMAGPSMQWLFTGLEDLKPDMIAEATRDARRAAEQFAHDAEATVGAIRTANQGYFSIEDRDPFSPETKKVRVVTTVSFVLE